MVTEKKASCPGEREHQAWHTGRTGPGAVHGPKYTGRGGLLRGLVVWGFFAAAARDARGLGMGVGGATWARGARGPHAPIASRGLDGAVGVGLERLGPLPVGGRSWDPAGRLPPRRDDQGLSLDREYSTEGGAQPAAPIPCTCPGAFPAPQPGARGGDRIPGSFWVKETSFWVFCAATSPVRPRHIPYPPPPGVHPRETPLEAASYPKG